MKSAPLAGCTSALLFAERAGNVPDLQYIGYQTFVSLLALRSRIGIYKERVQFYRYKDI